ncbi:hypothetical protein A8709_32890 [Paenibacillus pectinilyticus]|uniref:YopX protein domain-containing protein n=1 Tax=Paenibacillus pectinilyticus TaxID=512399 RepID=A0A1C0ZWZ0_9BACL|nr:YopX family protein [Paenibacillus pectinilyticus]OCT12609.1 hypothetical protein A8709_32890 [Paenibacillus pectinilyticus]
MRDYRFRVWNPATETMTYNVGLDSISEYADETLVKMLQSGIKDRKGNNIYEGDRLEIYRNNGFDDRTDEFIVIFFRGGFGVDDGLELWEYEDDYKRGNGYMEVIGNIYMTPELLKKE